MFSLVKILFSIHHCYYGLYLTVNHIHSFFALDMLARNQSQIEATCAVNLRLICVYTCIHCLVRRRGSKNENRQKIHWLSSFISFYWSLSSSSVSTVISIVHLSDRTYPYHTHLDEKEENRYIVIGFFLVHHQRRKTSKSNLDFSWILLVLELWLMLALKLFQILDWIHEI